MALGVCILEKHVTFSREDKGSDIESSIEPREMETLCTETKDPWLDLGEAWYARKLWEESNVKYCRSIYVIKDIKEGDVFSKASIRRIRPGYGLSPKYYSGFIGRKTVCDLVAGSALEWHHVQDEKR